MKEYARREFLIDAGKVAAGLIGALYVPGCGGSPTSPPGPTPVARARVTGRVKGTFSNRDVSSYDIKFNGERASVTPDGSYLIELPGGDYTIEVTSNGLMLPRKRDNVQIPGDTTLDMDGIERDAGFNERHYRETVMTNGSPGEKSYRFGNGVPIRVLLVSDGAPNYAPGVISDAVNQINGASRGKLSMVFSQIQSNPTTREKGSIIVVYRDDIRTSSSFLGQTEGFEIDDSNVLMEVTQGQYVDRAVHELLHGVGMIGHPNQDTDSILYQGRRNMRMDTNDELSLVLLMSRNPGHSLSDFDAD